MRGSVPFSCSHSARSFQVSIRATDDSRLLTWETEHLRDFLQDKPYFASVITNLLGKDITHKLYQVHEMLLSHPQYIRVLANKTSGSYLRHNLQRYSPSFARRKPNGILRQTSPPDSGSSSAGSRNTGETPVRRHARAYVPTRKSKRLCVGGWYVAGSDVRSSVLDSVLLSLPYRTSTHTRTHTRKYTNIHPSAHAHKQPNKKV